LTFVLMRQNESNRGAELIYLKEDVHSDVTNYVIAGLLNQADVTFYNFVKEMEGSVICVNYRRTGWDPRVMATEICRDATARRGEIRIWAFSVGDQAARFVAWMAADVKTVAINPCIKVACLKEDLRNFGGLARALRGFCEYGLGWLSLMPIISMAGTDTNAPNRNWKYSPILMMDQLVAITNGLRLLGQHESEYVILSEHDQFLDNEAVEKMFSRGETKFITIEADHAGTVHYAEEYRKAFRQIGWMRSDS